MCVSFVEDAEEYGLGCGEHTDYGFLSFVYQDHVTGCLQVRPLHCLEENVSQLKNNRGEQ